MQFYSLGPACTGPGSQYWLLSIPVDPTLQQFESSFSELAAPVEVLSKNFDRLNKFLQYSAFLDLIVERITNLVWRVELLKISKLVSLSIFFCACLMCSSEIFIVIDPSAISAATLKRSMAFRASPVSLPAIAAHKLITPLGMTLS